MSLPASLWNEYHEVELEVKRKLQTGEWSDLANYHKNIIWICEYQMGKGVDVIVQDIREGKFPIPEDRKNEPEPEYYSELENSY